MFFEKNTCGYISVLKIIRFLRDRRALREGKWDRKPTFKYCRVASA